MNSSSYSNHRNDELAVTCPACDTICLPADIAKWAQSVTTDQLSSHEDRGRTPITCECGHTFWVPLAVITHVTGTVTIDVPLPSEPNFTPNTRMRVINKEHPYYGRIGTVVGSKHAHYRVQFEDGAAWMPIHWLANTEQV